MIGKRIGKWTVERELGRGGMGRVYLAREAGGEKVAVKVLAAELAKEEGFLERFRREIDALSALNHPNIVRFYEAGSQDNAFYYVMEYVDGRNYEELLLENGRLEWEQVLDLALQISPALKHAHDHGVIHRDLKPPNLLRSTHGVVKLTDFGVAKLFASTQLTAAGGVVGTAEFLSPEQAAGKPVTGRSDLYSLGIVLYTLLTGRPPFRGGSTVELLHKHRFGQFDRPGVVIPELPHEFDEVICQLLEKDPAKRPADGMVLHRQLERMRDKLERKGRQTAAGVTTESTFADTGKRPRRAEQQPGPATLMGKLIRAELERQNRGGPVARFFNHPVVLVTLFVVCVSILGWKFFGPEPQSTEAEPSEQRGPNLLGERVSLNRAVGAARPVAEFSEAEHHYRQGLRHAQQGDFAAARDTWRNVTRAFRDIPEEIPWVKLAEEGLQKLEGKGERPELATGTVGKALDRARQRRDAGNLREAEDIWKGLESLYRNDPRAPALLQVIQKDRGK